MAPRRLSVAEEILNEHLRRQFEKQDSGAHCALPPFAHSSSLAMVQKRKASVSPLETPDVEDLKGLPTTQMVRTRSSNFSNSNQDEFKTPLKKLKLKKPAALFSSFSESKSFRNATDFRFQSRPSDVVNQWRAPATVKRQRKVRLTLKDKENLGEREKPIKECDEKRFDVHARAEISEKPNTADGGQSKIKMSDSTSKFDDALMQSLIVEFTMPGLASDIPPA